MGGAERGDRIWLGAEACGSEMGQMESQEEELWVQDFCLGRGEPSIPSNCRRMVSEVGSGSGLEITG